MLQRTASYNFVTAHSVQGNNSLPLRTTFFHDKTLPSCMIHAIALQQKTHWLKEGFQKHSLLVQLKLQGSNSFLLKIMPVNKSALAVIRHETSFAASDTYFDGPTRFVKFDKVWQSHRRFRNDYTVEDFYAILAVDTRNNGNKTFLFFPQQVAPFTTFEHVWVAAPVGR